MAKGEPRIVARPAPQHDGSHARPDAGLQARPDAGSHARPGAGPQARSPEIELPEARSEVRPERRRAGDAALNDGALRDLSAKLDTIKTDLMGVKRSLTRQKPEAEAEAAKQAEARAEIERIASGIEALQAAPKFDAEGFDRLQDELARLRQTMRTDLRQTVRNEVGGAIEAGLKEGLQES